MGMFQLKVILVLLSVVYVVNGAIDRCYSDFTSGQYVGCYVDNALRILGATSIRHPKNSIPFCMKYCGKRKYIYAGAESGNLCYCGNKTINAVKVADTECDMKCYGSKEKCGGSWRISVYKTEKIQYKDFSGQYLGCFIDQLKRILPGKHITSPWNSIYFCMRICKNNGYKYCGMEYYRHCYCANELHGNVQKVADSQCSTPCVSSRSETCGAIWRISVYKTEGIPPFDGEMRISYNDGCNVCKCVWYNHAYIHKCFPVQCEKLDCKEQEQQPGQCCPSCKKGCIEDGAEFKEGDPIPSTDRCETCTCEEDQENSGFMKKCSAMTCIQCPYGVEEDGTCCGRCKEEEDGECDPNECPLVQCVDPTKQDGSCCYTCQNGQTCMYKGKVILPNKQESFGKIVCMCGGSDNWHLDAYCRKKKVDKKNYKSVKKYKGIIDIPQV